MRYQNWDVLLFPTGLRIPIQEFKTACYAIYDGESLPTSLGEPVFWSLDSISNPLSPHVPFTSLEKHSANYFSQKTIVSSHYYPALYLAWVPVSPSKCPYTTGIHSLHVGTCTGELARLSRDGAPVMRPVYC